MVGRPTLVSSKPAASASTATARVHPASSSSSVNFGPSTAVGKPLASSVATTSKAPSLTEPSQANSETSGLKQFLQKILVQCSEGQIGFKMPFEVMDLIFGEFCHLCLINSLFIRKSCYPFTIIINYLSFALSVCI